MTERRVHLRTGGLYFGKRATGVEFFSSGCRVLDLILGGGWAEDRVINIIGDKSTGKTLLAIEAAANFAIKYSKARVRYREAESAFDKAYAAALGMPLGRVDFGNNPFETVEDLYEELEYRAYHAKQRELIIVDSLDALSSRAEMGRKIDDPSYGSDRAKKMSEIFRRLITPMAERHITLMIISQIRDKIGATFGRKFTRTGGRALDFYASQMLLLAHLGRIKARRNKIERVVGVDIKAQMDKSKVGLPFREATFPILFGYGIDDRKACLDYLKSEAKVALTDEILAMSDESLAHLVEYRFWQIERTFLPQRKKYA